MFKRFPARRALLVPFLAAAVLAVPVLASAQEDPWGRGGHGFRGGHESHEAWRDPRRDERRAWRREFLEDREDFFDRRDEFFDRREAWRDRRDDWRRDHRDWRRDEWDDRFDRHAFGRDHDRFYRHRFGRSFDHDDRFGRGFPPRRFFPTDRHSFGGHHHHGQGFHNRGFRRGPPW